MTTMLGRIWTHLDDFRCGGESEGDGPAAQAAAEVVSLTDDGRFHLLLESRDELHWVSAAEDRVFRRNRR